MIMFSNFSEITLYLHSFRWYFGKIKRVEAEKKLLSPENAHGAFLIRDSESRRNDYSLSGESEKKQFTIIKGCTVNFLNIQTPKTFVVSTLKFELCGSTIE